MKLCTMTTYCGCGCTDPHILDLGTELQATVQFQGPAASLPGESHPVIIRRYAWLKRPRMHQPLTGHTAVCSGT
jgi:hypothetical protein